MITRVCKRDGTIQDFSVSKIADAIFRAAEACGGSDRAKSEDLAKQVEQMLNKTFVGSTPTVEEIQNMVEKVLIENRHAQVAKAFILYRDKRQQARNNNALIGATIELFDNYLNNTDWQIKENANMQRSIAGLNNYVRSAFTKGYWLNEIYSAEIRDAHLTGALHIHDLDFLGSYCVGWDLRSILVDGFTGVAGKVSSSPAKHLRSFLGQVVNATFTTQGETAGAQAWSSFDTYCAPFIKEDNLTYKQVKQAIQEFIFNMNVPTRVGFQCPFSNITLDLKCPKALKDQPVIIGGKPQNQTYGQFQAEMDIFNQAFCDVMLGGDANGRVFTFPIPTINVTKELDWDMPVMESIMDITCKYGIPYFANYVTSDLSPDDAISMCCRLRLDVSELKKRGGGLFGSNPLTGSIGVVTLNLPRTAYLSQSKEEFFERLKKLAIIAKDSLEMKRKVVEKQTENGLYPYCAFYLRSVKERTGHYWTNHFNTIGVIGMNEAIKNLYGKDEDITTPKGQTLAIETLKYLRTIMTEFQQETGNSYNLEATPAEGTSARLAKLDKARFPQIITAGEKEPCYTNSTQLPVEFTDDIFKAVELQDELQSLYTGGTVLHLYLGEKIEDKEVCKKLIRKIFSTSKMPYISITPTFSICSNHGYIAGEHFSCPTCGKATEVWSRVVGFLRPVQDFNVSKREEFDRRKQFKISSNN
ncbi:MAG: ribonucleoside triphosphate reductase [Clostridia bacterium]